jgi:hypothetical protein
MIGVVLSRYRVIFTIEKESLKFMRVECVLLYTFLYSAVPWNSPT